MNRIRTGLPKILGVSLALALPIASVQAAEPIVLRDMGSFHVGWRIVESSGLLMQDIDAHLIEWPKLGLQSKVGVNPL